MTSRGIRHIGISFTTEMIEAILDGRKTETRRLATENSPLAKALPGDLLWVKEGFEVLEWMQADRRARIRYLTRCPIEGLVVPWPERLTMGKLGFKLPRFMPREACRIQLDLIARRREHLEAIDDAGAVAEGVDMSAPTSQETFQSGRWRVGSLRERYLSLWDRIMRCVQMRASAEAGSRKVLQVAATTSRSLRHFRPAGQRPLHRGCGS